jgi:hypothetical protein
VESDEELVAFTKRWVLSQLHQEIEVHLRHQGQRSALHVVAELNAERSSQLESAKLGRVPSCVRTVSSAVAID